MSVASCSVFPATVGTARLDGPVEMMAFTATPGSTCVPSAGSVRITSPAATVSLASSARS